jgi:hypothetical protein
MKFDAFFNQWNQRKPQLRHFLLSTHSCCTIAPQSVSLSRYIQLFFARLKFLLFKRERKEEKESFWTTSLKTFADILVRLTLATLTM